MAINGRIEGVRIAATATAVPTRKVHHSEYYPIFGQETVDRAVASTGVREFYYAHKRQTAGDLACAAARHLLEARGIDPASVGILAFVSNAPDYFCPATSNIIQYRLGLSHDCAVFDMNHGCAGFVYGIQSAGYFLAGTDARRALVLFGDTPSKAVSQLDRSCLLFGDAGAAVLLEKDDAAPVIETSTKNDGSRFRAIVVPAGGNRHPSPHVPSGANQNPPPNHEATERPDGNIRSDFDLLLNGEDIFTFTITDVVALIQEFLKRRGLVADDFDAALFHQANTFILKHLAKKLKLPPGKMPLSLDRYGNTSVATIPLTLSDAYPNGPDRDLRILFASFGVGLSWAVADAVIPAGSVLPIIHTDEWFDDGLIS